MKTKHEIIKDKFPELYDQDLDKEGLMLSVPVKGLIELLDEYANQYRNTLPDGSFSCNRILYFHSIDDHYLPNEGTEIIGICDIGEKKNLICHYIWQHENNPPEIRAWAIPVRSEVDQCIWIPCKENKHDKMTIICHEHCKI